MKLLAKIAFVLTVFTCFCKQSNAQIDTTWTYFHYRTDGTRVAGTGPGIPVDIRLLNDEFGIFNNRFFLVENKTFSFRRDNTGTLTDSYHPMAGFNTGTNYTQGQLKSEAYGERLRMNYRLIKPKNYPTNPNVEGGYPLIVMTHGFGERANCWGSNCYWSNAFWNTIDNNPQAVTYGISSASGVNGSSPTTFTTVGNHNLLSGQQVIIRNAPIPFTAYNGTRTITAVTANTFTVNINFSGTTTANVARPGVFELLNNDHSMTHGGNVHQTAVMLPSIGDKVPSDPTMPIRAFPGFVLFPQNLNGWDQGGAENVVRIIRLLMKKYNINPNKIYVHGLSDGGSATHRLVRTAPWLFAAALPMSAVNNPENNYPIYPFISSVPFWIFQGGIDGNPTKATTEQLIKNFRGAGMDVRYTLYPTLGHGVWNNAYAEQDFFRWMMLKDKANITVKFNNRTICGTSGVPTELILAQGFLAYQWEKDGVIISGATAYTYAATSPGTYRARFSRVANPGASNWNRWSDPIVITEVTPPKPIINALNTTVFPTINGGSDLNVTLQPSEKSEKYNWSINGTVSGQLWKPGTPNPVYVGASDTLYRIVANYLRVGIYTLKTNNISGCQSPSSDPVYVINPVGATLTAPSNFAGIAQNGSSIFLSWTDNSVVENGYEIWRRKAGDALYTFVARIQEDAVSYLDTNLTPVTPYQYKIRAVSSSARSSTVPGDDPSQFLPVSTLGDAILPTPPQNLAVTLNTIKSISLSWEPGTDNNGIKRYKINYAGIQSGSVFTTGPTTTFTLSGLTTNNAYQITVQTEDLFGNLSPPSNQITGLTYVDGLYYEHSTGAWNSLTPSISAQNDTPPIDWTSAEFTGKISNFNVNPNITFYGEPPGIATQQDFYKIKFSGYITTPPALYQNTFRFRMTSNDGGMLFLKKFNPNFVPDDSQNTFPTEFTTVGGVINNDGIYDWTESADVVLDSTYHQIVLLFREFIDGQDLTIQYRRKTGNNSYESTWTTIPNSMLRTGTPTAPTLPNIPTSLVATAAGMTIVNLTWQYSGPATGFEVYRSTTDSLSLEIIGHATTLAFSDNTALPGTTYYYKLKSVNANGTSAFNNKASSATTAMDGVAPSVPAVPAGLTLISQTFSNVVFSWTASTDNVGVTGYEILNYGTPIGTTAITGYMATGLEPGTLYNFSVKAFDAAGNKSAASSVLPVTTNSGQVFYSNANGALNVNTNWGTAANGTGTAPTFANNGQIYTVANRVSTGLGGALTIGGSVSKIIVPTGTTFTVDNPISAKIEVQGNAVVNLNNATAPEFLSVSPTSTVNFNTYAYVPAGTYGHINLTGTSNKNFAAGETLIKGNLTATPDTGKSIALKGVPGNGSHVTIEGDITLNGATKMVASDNALDLGLAKPGMKTIAVSDTLDLYKISTAAGTNVNIVNGGSAIIVNVGSANGGGLSLANGTTLNLGNNHLVMKNAGTINAAAQTGKLAITGSNLNLTSTSAQNSNVYFDTALKTAGLVTSNFSSTGKLIIQSPVLITEGLKIKAGEFRSSDPLQPLLPGNVTLVSTSAKTAYLQEIEGNGSVTGKVNVQRWVSVARKYRYMSSVVENMTVALWQQGGMSITGPFSGTSGSQTPSMFYYHEPDVNPNAVPPHNGYNRFPVSLNTEMLVRGRGYSIFNYSNTALTLTMTGKPYQGSVPFILTGDPTPANLTPADTLDGWNLVGNPYASAIQWNNNLGSDWVRTGISPIVYVPDNTIVPYTGVKYKIWHAVTGQGTLSGGIIAPGQAFWVKAISANPTMTVNEKAKRASTSIFYREGDSPVNSITIRLSNGAIEDVSYVTLSEEYNDTYEPEADGKKLKNGTLNLSTRSVENFNLAFNLMSDSFCEKTIALNVDDVTPGQYTLAFDNIENLVGVGAVALTDHFTNTTTAITNSTPYSFAVTTAAASFGASRFSLTLNRPALQKNAVATIEKVCGGTTSAIQLTNTQAGVFYYASKVNESNALSGEVVGTGGNITLEIPVSSLQLGANSVVIHTGFKGCSNELLTTTPLVFNYTPSPLVAVDKPFLSLCADTQVTLTAETNVENSLRWYKDGELIANQTGASWLSAPLKKTTLFEVAAVSNGCEGKKAAVYVEINKATMPLIEFTGVALEIVNDIPADNFIQWYINGSPLDAYDKGIVPKEEGLYSVLVAKGGCSMVSVPFEFLVTGIENPLNEPFQAYVYPVPATFDQLYVKLQTTSKQNALVTMVDLAGRTIFTQSINGSDQNGVHKLDVAQDTTPGLYIMKIQQGNAVLQRKVILHFK